MTMRTARSAKRSGSPDGPSRMPASPSTGPTAPLSLDSAWSDISARLGLGAILRELALGAVGRDEQRRLLFPEIEQLRAHGLPSVRLPATSSGAGLSLAEFFRLARDLATADPNIPHALRNHFAVVERHLRTPDRPFSRRVLKGAGAGRIFGIAAAEAGLSSTGNGRGRDTRLHKSPDGRGYTLSGVKSFSTGNLYADILVVSAFDEEAGAHRELLIPRDRAGVDTPDDWNGFGQKLTGSGSTSFDRVAVAADELFDPDPAAPSSDGLYEFTFHQVFLTTVISGIGQRILLDGVALVASRRRNFYHGLAEQVADEPEIQALVGQIAADAGALTAAIDRAIGALEQSWADRTGPEARARSLRATIAALEAKVFADLAAPRLASALIDLASGSSVSTGSGLDRHWRNIKVLSAHNPRVYKERVLGNYYLNGVPPPTGPFF